MDSVFDVAIIGGGINGCGCAADAALRGLSVVLCEQDDLASKTSSKSTKLIHGGLRYLEQFDFSLVKKALLERQILQNVAPHLVHPISFVLPYQNNLRPLWTLRTGLFLYDHLSSSNRLPHSTLITRKKDPNYFAPLDPLIHKGFLFYDCFTDDARLTITNALQASLHGASIMPQTKLIHAQVVKGIWQILVQKKQGKAFQIKAKSIINAAGPWVNDVNQLLKIPVHHDISLVKGSHIVIKKLYEGEHAYLLQHPDKRIVFTIPYYGHTLIGTTDVAFSDTPNNVQIAPEEIDYLFNLIQPYFNKQLKHDEIITTWSGIRTLLSDHNKTPSHLSRDYALHYADLPAPAVTILGGKLTTYRKLALHAIDKLLPVFPEMGKSLTEHTLLPGATWDNMAMSTYTKLAQQNYDWLDPDTLARYINQYGTRIEHILKDCQSMKDLGACFSPTLYQAEIDYLVHQEWATHPDDILWRRTKLGLSMNEREKNHLSEYLKQIHVPDTV